jgi:hypothetical protein
MRWLWLPFLVLVLGGCGTSLKNYHNTEPRFQLEEFFVGDLTAYGMVQDRSGTVLRRFRVDMTATWQGNKGVLDELFYYDDGEQQRRVWYLTKNPDGSYSGNADDVVVPARGSTSGFALNWHYTLEIPVDGSTWEIHFDDWMYLLDENRLINRAEMTKWGFRVGEVILWIEKNQNPSAR